MAATSINASRWSGNPRRTLVTRLLHGLFLPSQLTTASSPITSQRVVLQFEQPSVGSVMAMNTGAWLALNDDGLRAGLVAGQCGQKSKKGISTPGGGDAEGRVPRANRAVARRIGGRERELGGVDVVKPSRVQSARRCESSALRALARIYRPSNQRRGELVDSRPRRRLQWHAIVPLGAIHGYSWGLHAGGPKLLGASTSQIAQHTRAPTVI